MNTTKYKVGQTLYFAHSDRRNGPPHEVTITKVGRKWLHLSDNRCVDIETLIEKSEYGNPGKCYESKDHYESLIERNLAWSQLRASFASRYEPPKGVTVENIKQARRLLFPFKP